MVLIVADVAKTATNSGPRALSEYEGARSDPDCGRGRRGRWEGVGRPRADSAGHHDASDGDGAFAAASSFAPAACHRAAGSGPAAGSRPAAGPAPGPEVAAGSRPGSCAGSGSGSRASTRPGEPWGYDAAG